MKLWLTAAVFSVWPPLKPTFVGLAAGCGHGRPVRNDGSTPSSLQKPRLHVNHPPITAFLFIPVALGRAERSDVDPVFQCAVFLDD